MTSIYNKNAIAELCNRGYHNRHIAIVMGCIEETIERVRKEKDFIEPTLKFLSIEQKQRLFVLDKMLQLKPLEKKWGSNDYYYITILKFLLIPREQIYEIYKRAPLKHVAQAHREKAPKLQLLDYTLLGVTSEEYKQFIIGCYKVIGDPTKWK